MKKRDHSKTAGFTLIELLVVIAILAILVAVGIPVYTGYISHANDAAVSTELNAVLTAAEAANATNSARIETIEVMPNGKVTVELEEGGMLSSTFYSDFAAFYGMERKEEEKEYNESITIDSLGALLQKSETYKTGATWEWLEKSWKSGTD